MKIGIISHSPLWTTGFGVTCNQIAHTLAKINHEVICLSVGERDELVDEKSYPFKIWPIQWKTAYKQLAFFFKHESPDVILFNFDIKATAYFLKYCNLLNYNQKKYGHIVMDGFPISDSILKAISQLDGIIVPTMATKTFLISKKISNVYYAPHGVDILEFKPVEDKGLIRNKLQYEVDLMNKYIIGVFAKNEERKQIPKILLALRYLVHTLKEKDIFIYLHTQPKPNPGKGWDLKFIIDNLKISDYVILTPNGFNQDLGINYTEDFQLNYIELINMCDLIVNVPFSGGFELCNIEAQSCGIPLITINDNGNISEVSADAALYVNPKMSNIWGDGAIIYLIDEIELADKILQVKNDTALSKKLKEKGFENIKRFSWSHLEKIVQEIFQNSASF